MKSAWALPGAVLFLVFLSIYCYYEGRYDYPRKDHPVYLLERDSFESDARWFTHSLFFSRTRLLTPGDRFLYRPGLMAVLAAQDIFLRDKLLAIGWISIAIFTATVLSFFFFLKRHFSLGVATLFASVYATQPVGAEMTLWRHITPYLLSAFFLFLAFSAQRNWVVCLFLTLAMLFHEYVALTALFVVVGCYGLRGITSVRIFDEATRSFVTSLAVALALFLMGNITDYLIHTPAAPAVSEVVAERISLVRSLSYFFTMFASSARAAFLSYSVGLAIPVVDWPYGKEALNVWLGGLLGFSLAGFVGYQIVRRWKAKAFTLFDLQILFCLLAILAIVLGLAVGRGNVHGIVYLSSAARYYFAITTALWLVVAASLFRAEFALPKTRKFLVVILCLTVPTQAKRLRDDVSGYALIPGKAFSLEIARWRNFFEARPDHCLSSHVAMRADGTYFPYRIYQPLPEWVELIPMYLRGYECGRRPTATIKGYLKAKGMNEPFDFVRD